MEKSERGSEDGGADLALWPAATKVLKELGVGSSDPSKGNGDSDEASDFWVEKTYPVRRVRICKVDEIVKNGAGVGHRNVGDNDGFLDATPNSILKAVDMDAVVEGEGEPFRLVGRQAVMGALLGLVENRHVRQGLRVVRVTQGLPPEELKATVYVARTMDRKTEPPIPQETLACRVLVGADGIHSVCRLEVSASTKALKALVTGGDIKRTGPCGSPGAHTGAEGGPRDGGEVCYRGVFDLREGSDARVAAAGLGVLFKRDEEEHPSSMSVVYGDRIRFSWGFLDGVRETGYWFVKQLIDEASGGVGGNGTAGEHGGANAKQIGEAWPEPLRTFARVTGKDCSYVHRIQDRPPLDRYVYVFFLCCTSRLLSSVASVC